MFYAYIAINDGNISNSSFTSTKSNVADFDFLKTDNWMNFTSHSQTSNFFALFIYNWYFDIIYFNFR